MEMKSKLGWRRVTLSASCAVIVCGIAAALRAQAPAFSITLTDRDAWRASGPRRGDLSQAADLLRSWQLRL